jgi:predicted nucleic acid-binding protein
VIVLDTNVISEALRTSPSPQVMHWLAACDAGTVFTTSISQAEILRGLEMLPPGRRKTLLAAAVGKIFSQEFKDRILPFDDEAAPVYAAIVARRSGAGRPISQSDAMIGAICKSRRAAIATRNVRDFDLCGIRITDPWRDSE